MDIIYNMYEAERERNGINFCEINQKSLLQNIKTHDFCGILKEINKIKIKLCVILIEHKMK